MSTNSTIESRINSRHPKCKGWYKYDVGMVDGPDWVVIIIQK